MGVTWLHLKLHNRPKPGRRSISAANKALSLSQFPTFSVLRTFVLGLRAPSPFPLSPHE